MNHDDIDYAEERIRKAYERRVRAAYGILHLGLIVLLAIFGAILIGGGLIFLGVLIYKLS